MSDRSRPMQPPVVLSSTFAFDSADEMARAATEKHTPIYTRWSNPTLDALENQLAVLEGAERALVTGSGMAAIHLALLAGAMRGGTLLVLREVYGGTHELVETLFRPLGVDVVRAGLTELYEAARALPAKSMVHIEIPTNPLIRLVDLPRLRAAAPRDAWISVDATFGTPIHVQPLSLGANLVVHSVTKYLAGHHDVIAGVVAGNAGIMERVWTLRKLTGPVLDPAAAHRIARGLETLELRVVRQTETAQDLARRLVEHDAVKAVHHPSLADHPDAAIAHRDLNGAGGVLSFELATGRAAAACVDAFEHIQLAPSLGGTQSTACLPGGASHVGLSEAERALSGLPDGLVRLACGVEDAAVLWTDLRRGLGAAMALADT